MKNRTIIFFAALIIVSTTFFMFYTWHETMLRSFGSESFSVERWAAADNQERAEMVYSFVTSNDIYSMTSSEIKGYLGPPNAYYNYDSFPTYTLVNNDKRYLIAFIIGQGTRKVERYVVRSYPFSKNHHAQAVNNTGVVIKLIIDNPQLQYYLHPETPGRKPLKIKSNANLGTNITVNKYNQPVEFLDPNAHINGLPVLDIETWDATNDNINFKIHYEIEGVTVQGQIHKIGNYWNVENYSIFEN